MLFYVAICVHQYLQTGRSSVYAAVSGLLGYNHMLMFMEKSPFSTPRLCVPLEAGAQDATVFRAYSQT